MIRYMTYTYAHICFFSCINIHTWDHATLPYWDIHLPFILRSLSQDELPYISSKMNRVQGEFEASWHLRRSHITFWWSTWIMSFGHRTKSPLALMTLQEVGWSGIVGSPCGFQDFLIQNTQQNGLTVDFVATNFNLISIKSWTSRMFSCFFSKQLFNAQEMEVCHSQIPDVHWYSSHRRLKQIFEELFLELCSHAFVICCALAGEEV